MNKTSKKSSILENATRLFASKGYDATGMEEIAAQTGVPKSLIYYHFKNKEDLLHTIITDFLNEYSRILHDDTQQGIGKISVYMEFLKKNQDCAKIFLGESLKSGRNGALIFKTLAPLMEIDGEQPPGGKMDHAHWVAEFFTSIAPTLLLACYEEGWCDYFGVAPALLEKDYARAYELTHGAYHRFIDKESL